MVFEQASLCVHEFCQDMRRASSLVRYVILAISVAKIDFIVFMASLGVK